MDLDRECKEVQVVRIEVVEMVRHSRLHISVECWRRSGGEGAQGLWVGYREKLQKLSDRVAKKV